MLAWSNYMNTMIITSLVRDIFEYQDKNFTPPIQTKVILNKYSNE